MKPEPELSPPDLASLEKLPGCGGTLAALIRRIASALKGTSNGDGREVDVGGRIEQGPDGVVNFLGLPGEHILTTLSSAALYALRQGVFVRNPANEVVFLLHPDQVSRFCDRWLAEIPELSKTDPRYSAWPGSKSTILEGLRGSLSTGQDIPVYYGGTRLLTHSVARAMSEALRTEFLSEERGPLG